MFHHSIRVLTAVTLVWMASVVSCYGETAPKPDLVTITGIVKAAARNAEEAATVQVEKQVYQIVKDAKGKIVARDAAGKKAEIRGTVTERNGVKWMTVSWCALVE